MKSAFIHTLRLIAAIMIAALAISCGHDSTEGDDDIKFSEGYLLGGLVSGLQGTLVLQSNGENDLTISSDGLFVFDALIANGAAYNVTVKSEPGMQLCPVTNPSGTMTIAGVSDVTIACRSWSVPLASWDNISPAGTGATSPAIAVDSAGGAVVIWRQPDNSAVQRIYAATLSGGLWSEPASLADYISDVRSDASAPSLDMGPQGVALAAWTQTAPSGHVRVYVSMLQSGLWSVATPISPDLTDASGVTVSMDESGGAVVSWQQDDAGGLSRVYASTRTAAGAWTHPSGLTDALSSLASGAAQPHCAMAGGRAIVTWQQPDSAGDTQIFKAEFSGDAWALPSGLSDNLSPSGTMAGMPRVAMASSQSAVIVWLQKDDLALDEVMAASLYNGVWDAPDGMLDAIGPGSTSASALSVTMGSAGSAIAVWQQPTGDGTSGIFGAIMKSGSWSVTPTSNSDTISPAGAGASEPQAAMDSHGKAVVIWKQPNSSGVSRILKAHYNDKWHRPTTSDTIYGLSPSETSASSAAIAMNASAQAVASWQQSDGSNTRILKATLGY